MPSLPASSIKIDPNAGPVQVLGQAADGLGFPRRPGARQRVLDLAGRFGADLMGDVEILMLQFAPGDRAQLVDRSEALLVRFGGLAGVLAADRAELARHVAESTIVNFRILREVAGRVALAGLVARPVLSSWRAAADFFKAKLRGLAHEEFWVAFLDKKNQLIVVEQLGRGTVDHAPVYVREVVKRALECGASALLLAHNHPSGDPTPSQPDITMTKSIADAARPLGVALHDHLVVGSQSVASFKTLGLL